MKKEKLYFTRIHRILEAAAYVLLFMSLAAAIARAIRAGNTEVPVHYDAHWNPDNYGSAWSLLVLPIIMLLTNGIISLLLHFLPPSSWNMPTRVKPGRELISYRLAALALVLTELCMGLFTLVITAVDISGPLVPILLLVILTASLLIPIILIVRVNRD